METMIIIQVVLISYLIGSISFSRLITRLVAPDIDLSKVEIPAIGAGKPIHLRHYGANTAAMKLGPRWGCAIGLLDILKATFITLAFKFIYPDQPYFLLAAVFVIVGHNWPVYYRFKGGGGMSTIYGGFLAVDWLGTIVCSTLGMFLGMAIIKDVLLAYISGAWLMIPWLWFRTHDFAYLAYAITVNLLFILALLPEISEQIKARREGQADFEGGMQSFPMGRAMLKLMRMFHLKQ